MPPTTKVSELTGKDERSLTERAKGEPAKRKRFLMQNTSSDRSTCSFKFAFWFVSSWRSAQEVESNYPLTDFIAEQPSMSSVLDINRRDPRFVMLVTTRVKKRPKIDW